MKRIIRCLGCGKTTKFYGSYKAILHEHIKSPLTGEVKKTDMEGRLCRDCGVRMGYKIKKLKEKHGNKSS